MQKRPTPSVASVPPIGSYWFLVGKPIAISTLQLGANLPRRVSLWVPSRSPQLLRPRCWTSQTPLPPGRVQALGRAHARAEAQLRCHEGRAQSRDHCGRQVQLKEGGPPVAGAVPEPTRTRKGDGSQPTLPVLTEFQTTTGLVQKPSLWGMPLPCERDSECISGIQVDGLCSTCISG